jgi:hypothetical protein
LFSTFSTMKVQSVIITAISILLLTHSSSCSRRHCETRILKGVCLKDRELTTDTAAKIISFEKGTDFSKKIDSSYTVVSPGTAATIQSQGPSGYFSCDFSDNTRDYLLILLPSGITHKIKDIKYGSELSYGSHLTMCSYGYNLDGKNEWFPETDDRVGYGNQDVPLWIDSY